jgi:4-amino-4-deoxy-L-arabinose transferase-like glycosyltransferase
VQATERVTPDATTPTEGSSRSTRWFGWALLAVALLALTVRLVYTFTVADDIALAGDAQTYHLLAARLADGDGYVRTQGELAGTPTAEFPPLFPAALAIVDLAGGDSVNAQKVFTACLGTATVVLIGLAGRRVRGPTVGLVAAGLAAVYPMLFQVDAALMAESLYGLLVAGFLFAIYRALDDPSRLNWVIAGALAGLAALTRTEGLLLVPFVLLPEALRRGGSTWRSRWASLGLGVLATLVVITPWIARNALTFDRFIPVSNNSGTLIAGANCDRTYAGQYKGIWRFECVTDIDVAGLDEPAVADRFRHVGMEYASAHAGQVPSVAAIRVLRTFGLYEPKQQMDWESFEGRNVHWQVAGHRMFLVLLPLSVIGAVLLARGRRPWWPLVAPVAVVLVTSAISYGNQRFRVVAEPGILVLAAVSLVTAAQWIGAAVARRARPG